MERDKIIDETARMRLVTVGLIVIAIIVVAVMCSAKTSHHSPPSAYSLREVVKRNLKDPDSAKFTNERVVPMGEGYALCGTVNAKNSYGGYAGPTRFIAGLAKGGGDILYMENDIELGSLFAGVWDKACM